MNRVSTLNAVGFGSFYKGITCQQNIYKKCIVCNDLESVALGTMRVEKYRGEHARYVLGKDSLEDFSSFLWQI